MRGFSLLELLVVVFIIGILATMFTLSFGLLGNDPQLEKEADRLQSLILLARESALTNGREYGLHFYPNQYEFAVYQEDFVEYFDPDDEENQDQSQWIQIPPGELLGPQLLADGITLELDIDGREILLKDPQTPLQAAPVIEDETIEVDPETGLTPYRPQVWLFSTGDMNPFVIRLRREFENDGIELEFSEDGSVERFDN